MSQFFRPAKRLGKGSASSHKRKGHYLTRQRLTHYHTLNLPDILKIGGDLLLLPPQQPLPYENVRALRGGRTVSPEESLLELTRDQVIPLELEYKSHRLRTGREPRWMRFMPVTIQTHLRGQYALTELDAFMIIPDFRRAGLSYMIIEGGLVEALHQTFKLQRLGHIKQLGFLESPWSQDLGFSMPAGEHTRLLHSLDVMTIATVIGYNLGLPWARLNTLRTAACLHDMGTPAGGDSVKLVDPEAFDEDANFPTLLEAYDYKPVFKRFGVNKKLLCEAVMGKGLLGQILDLADKLAYVARDIDKCDPFICYSENHLDQHGIRTLFSLLERYPHISSVWDAVTEIDGQAVVEDGRRLAQFLKARTLMFREVYYHPNARFTEYLISRMLVKTLYDKGTLTRDQLIGMGDYQLMAVLDREFGERWHSHAPQVYTGRDVVHAIASSEVERVNCYTREEADQTLARLRAEGKRFSIVEDDTRNIIKTGDHLLVATSKGPLPFKDAYPGDAQELKEMALLYPTIYVYYLNREPPLPKETLAELAEAFKSAS